MMSSVLILNNNHTYTSEKLVSQREPLLLQNYPKRDYRTIKSFAEGVWKLKMDSGRWATELGMWVIGYEFSTRVADILNSCVALRCVVEFDKGSTLLGRQNMVFFLKSRKMCKNILLSFGKEYDTYPDTFAGTASNF